MYNPHIKEGNAMFSDLVRQHAGELYFAEYFFEKMKYDDGFEQIVPKVYLEFKR